MSEAIPNLIRRYLDDATAAERSFGNRSREERLAARLDALGASPSATKTLLAQWFHASPETSGKPNLVASYAAEQSSVAMYEALATIAEAAGDPDTAELARSLCEEARSAAGEIWEQLPLTASAAAQAAI